MDGWMDDYGWMAKIRCWKKERERRWMAKTLVRRSPSPTGVAEYCRKKRHWPAREKRLFFSRQWADNLLTALVVEHSQKWFLPLWSDSMVESNNIVFMVIIIIDLVHFPGVTRSVNTLYWLGLSAIQGPIEIFALKKRSGLITVCFILFYLFSATINIQLRWLVLGSCYSACCCSPP